jgi:hypothetical protein
MGWVVNATPRPFYHRERPSTHRIGGVMGPRVALDGYGKSHPEGCPKEQEIFSFKWPSVLNKYKIKWSLNSRHNRMPHMKYKTTKLH